MSRRDSRGRWTRTRSHSRSRTQSPAEPHRRIRSPDRVQDILTRWADATTAIQERNSAILRQLSDVCVVNRQQVPAGDRARITVPTFDGSRSWAVFSAQFNDAADALNWTPEEQGRRLLNALHGAASDLVVTLPAGEYLNYESLTRVLSRHYASPHQSSVSEAELDKRTQRSGESLQQYGADVLRLARAAYPTWQEEAVQTVARKAFLAGISDPEVRKMTRLHQPATLTEALTVAIQAQTVEVLEQPAGKRARVCQVTCRGSSSRADEPCCSGTAARNPDQAAEDDTVAALRLNTRPRPGPSDTDGLHSLHSRM